MSEPAEKEAVGALCSVESWAEKKGTAASTFAAAHAYERWPVGIELNEAAFDAAIAAIEKLSPR